MKFFLLLFLFISNTYAINFEEVREDYQSLLEKKYILLPHKPVYILPAVYNDNPNNKVFEGILEDNGNERGKFNKNLETEFQISFMLLTTKNAFNSGFNIFAAYTHRAFWQLYNDEWSKPFRETNYTPEVFARYLLKEPKTFFGINLVGYDFGLVHQSNGQVQELSRSWNRIFSRFAMYSGNTFINLSLWYRIPENEEDDENPNIYQYKGYGELEVLYKFGDVDTSLKIIPGTKNMGAELAVSIPWKEGLRFYGKASYGYGLSLLDYNHDNRRVGVGIVLSSILDQNSNE